ncbi:hypothetical protein N0V93_009430 [Gnomoniopsis smithogilvyi]|uniref:EGF-like domain-containing protein n=1 Tax=Gnomoniopsis smithogilvyi TaxID=1191159 RepID=A0A9W9CTN2_9PEZI|nr:hypothetical protein N0V93_009430 [Gnomoniopsis smithogilvyi]
MDRSATGDIIRRARERAEAGLPREDYETFLRRQQAELSNSSGSPSTPEIPPRNRPPQGSPDSGPPRQRLQAPPGLQGKDGQLALQISRPAPVPQWPLAGPLATPSTPSDAEPYRPPAGSSPPQRPPRPSHVPSILDGSKIQDPTPSFQYQPSSDRDSDYISSSVPETPSTLSRPSTLSSVASIPDFPLPIQAPPPPAMGPPRRSVTLGPPPSARRGASSFYSHLSYVSPIPEESPRSRSHTSYASSAAMPENWGTPSPIDSTRYAEVFYDETVTEPDEPSPASIQSMHFDEDGDESRLVRNASVGRRGKAALVTTLTPTAARDASRSSENSPERPGAAPAQSDPFNNGTGFLETSTNSSTTVPTLSTGRTYPSTAAPSAEEMIIAFDAASAMDPRASRRMSEVPNNYGDGDNRFSRGFSRLSAIRRPPRLDIDAVRNAETRGSLTSLPDLIRRATRLAASLDRGRRPASRFDLDDFPAEFYGAGNTNEYYDDKHRSGLSDMLAAFPPPAQAGSRTGIRQSLRDSVLSWPLPPLNNNGNGFGTPRGELDGSNGYSSRGSTPQDKKKGRRCCGLPLWGFILIVIIILVLVAAAVIIPIEFFVIRRNNQAANTTAAADQQCQNQLTCQNGGTNVVTNGICSCICSNGFTGFDCSTSDSAGCTTTTVSGATNINNVTLGDAIPRLFTEASSNFSITLSDTAILGKLNAGNLSCTSQNALVTFNGDDASAVSNVALADSLSNNVLEAAAVENVGIATLTIMAGQSTTTTLTIGLTSLSPTTTVTITRTMTSNWVPSTTSTLATTTPSLISTATTATSAPATTTSASFTVSQDALDFARVGVLLILQQDSLSEATTAQSSLQTFFTSAATGATIAAASNISLSNGNSIDLVNFKVDAGTGLVGSLVTSTKRDLEGMSFDLWA